MEVEKLKQALQGISSRDLAQRTCWYSPAAEAYHSTRPGYPAELMEKAINTSFEEWDGEPQAFDAVLAASSMHWIPTEIGYAKASRALKRDGYLILLWNKELQHSPSMQEALSDVYRREAPSLGPYEDKATQQAILNGLGQIMLDSGRFRNLVTTTVETSLTYTADQYLSLLTTYSSYLKLDHRTRNALFAGLRHCILEKGGGEIQLSYLSAYHIAQKI